MSCRAVRGDLDGSVGAATFAAAQLFRAIPRVRLSRVVGRLCEQPLPPGVAKIVERAFVGAYGIDLDEAEPRPDAYPSFDALFTRPLRDGAREIHHDPLVSPADGVVQAAGRLGPDGVLQAKGQSYTVAELTGETSSDTPYRNGTFAVIYLSPRDYHRVHAPVDGRITRVRGIAGDLFPVNSIGERIPGLYVRNSRVAIRIDTRSLGLVTVVMVGAVLVGKISVRAVPAERVASGLHELQPAVEVRKGEELGTFHLGSTVVLLLESEQLGITPGRRVRYGESLLQAS
jgi:phosphatidylserine decarboxylase